MTEKFTVSDNFKLFIAVIICQTVGITAAFLTSTQNNIWFDSLVKPSWNPPGYLFAPIWTTLYLLMGISLSIIWRSHAMEPYKTTAMLLFAGQLFLNFWWTILFFRIHSPIMAFLDIILMIISIFITIFAFASISKTAAWLLVPYISWVCFATVLNYTICKLN